MKNLMLNELTKLVRKKKFFIILGILTIIIVILSSFTADKNVEMLYTNSIPQRIIDQRAGTSRERVPVAQLAARQKESQGNKRLENLNEDMALLEQLLENRIELSKVNADWKNLLKKEIEYLEKRKSLIEARGGTFYIEDINMDIQKDQHLLKHNIKYEEKPKSTAFYAFPAILYYSGRLFLLMIVCIFVSDMVSGEREANTIKALLTKPVSRGKILFSKFLTIVLTTNVIILVLEGISFVLFGLFKGFGNPNVPMFAGTKYQINVALLTRGGNLRPIEKIIGSTKVLPAWQVSIRILLLQILLVTACISFCFLLSTFFKSNLSSTSIGFIVLIIVFVATLNSMDIWKQMQAGIRATSLTQKILPFLFSTYYDLMTLVDGSLSYMLFNPSVTVPFMTTVCLAWIIICYGISHLLFTRRDVL